MVSTTQPIWSMTATDLGLWIAGGSVVAYAAIEAIRQIGLKLIGVWFGWKKSIHDQVAELQDNVKTLAQASSVSDTVVTPAITNKINTLASGA